MVGLAALVPISLMTCDAEHLFIGAYLPSSCFVEVSVQVICTLLIRLSPHY